MNRHRRNSFGPFVLDVFRIGIIMIDYLEKGITITDKRLHEAIKEKIECCFTNKHYVPVHNAAVTKYAVHEAGFQLMENYPHSPDLDSSAFFHFSRLRTPPGNKINNDSDVMVTVEDFVEGVLIPRVSLK